ncbi:Major facilitator superfamily domain general substrate transporter [Penicillium subrubescens]|uniref:Major facilitator superfamily domain general substrate transporter n=1 Tax=Penicillium subrubescens TaxID=1316194 RepID=UPI002545502F|nr:Major facilitator superfamily domain general substrate transporter [Penicillium subrubescens]KAJ5880389.1 Major facilitator superfamily domain general substrate transporter [Penicillium subrubescens]
MGRRDEALFILKRVRGTANERAAIFEMREIETIVELEKESEDHITYFDMLLGTGNENLHIARRVQLVVWLQILQSWTGIAGVTMYAPSGPARGGLDHADNQGPRGIAATSMVYLDTFIFGATWLTVPWLYPAEIFPLKVRVKGNTWGVVGWSLGNGHVF